MALEKGIKVMAKSFRSSVFKRKIDTGKTKR